MGKVYLPQDGQFQVHQINLVWGAKSYLTDYLGYKTARRFSTICNIPKNVTSLDYGDDYHHTSGSYKPRAHNCYFWNR